MGVEENAIASLEFIDSICSAIQDKNIVDVSMRKSGNDQTPKIFDSDFCLISSKFSRMYILHRSLVDSQTIKLICHKCVTMQNICAKNTTKVLYQGYGGIKYH